MIAGFELPDAGEILLDGRNIADTPPEKRPLHTVFQSYALFPHMLRGGLHVIEVPVDRAANTALHGTLREAVRARLEREFRP